MTPFTPDEKETLNTLLLRAKETGDDAAFEALAKMASDPDAFRKAVAGFKGQ